MFFYGAVLTKHCAALFQIFPGSLNAVYFKYLSLYICIVTVTSHVYGLTFSFVKIPVFHKPEGWM